ncbi:dehydrogenase [Thalassobaculum fulvum]|uniref:Dehydrogenase n=1 Tax=Thalassobaculum fulvum TaxID=1633335 RepID=A0A918XPF1_9PROT|nr:FAD-dependent oxidoreductase [Thalassobaculum fulvum]GHD44344.1 dehydrogenase [Thalassobaculum fulvum]
MAQETYDCDVLVVGSGAGGLASAVAAAHRGLKTLVVEKEPVFGGTTARSGGWMWVPGNAPARRAGIEDSAEKAKTYLRHETGERFDEARVDAFLEAGPKAVDFFEQSTSLQFDLGPTFADYHPKAPGGMDAGRSIVARPFDGRELGGEIKRLRPPLAEITFLGMMIGSGKELLHFFNVTRSPVSAFYVAKLFVKFLRDMAFHGRPMRLMNGNALIGRLAKSCFDKGVPIWTRAPVRQLIRNDAGAVTGALVDTAKGTVEVRAAKGVVLAAGGFPQDPVRRKAMFGHAESGYEHASPAPPGNTGDGLRLGEAVGASVETELPNAAAWVPISRPPRKDGTLGTFPHFVDRSKPGVIAVTRSGRRFCNEADSYHDFGQSLTKRIAEEGGEICAFFVCDHRVLRKYGLGHVKPAPVPFGHHLRSGYLFRGDTPEALAREIGADPAQFAETIRKYNEHARTGEDPEFGRGTTSYNRSLGDPEHKPNPCVAPLETGPFYAVKVVMGDLGTFAGLRCNQNAQVLGDGGRPIPGLYAAGNDAASIMGGNYPGGGITLGPAITFGYIAARHMSGANA